jgi:hypothetical protein
LKQSDDWTFDIDNDFAEQLCNISLPPTLTNQSRVLDDCDCCTALFDLSEGNASYSSAFVNRPYESIRLSDIREAAEICQLCKFVLQATAPYNDSASEDLELHRNGATLRMGYDGPRILRLCADPGQFRLLPLDD